YKWIRLPDGTTRSMTKDEKAGLATIPIGARRWRYGPLSSSGSSPEGSKPFEYRGKSYSPGPNNHWKVKHEGLQKLADAGMLVARKNSLAYYLFADSYPVVPINNAW